jgi:hypothetical protein
MPPAARNPFEKGFLTLHTSQNFLLSVVWGQFPSRPFAAKKKLTVNSGSGAVFRIYRPVSP